MISSGNHEGLVLANRYQIGTLDANGKLCAVYRGHDTTLRRPVAIKAVPPELTNTYRTALHAISTLAHPAIISTYDAIEQDGWLFVIQEFVAARSLALYLRSGVPAQRAIDLGLQIARALSYAHAHGITHGDLTPAAVLVDRHAIVRINNFAAPRDEGYFTQYTEMRFTCDDDEPGETETTLTVPVLTSEVPDDEPRAESPAPMRMEDSDPQVDDVWASGLLLWLLLTEPCERNSVEESSSTLERTFRQDVPDDVRKVISRIVLRTHPQRIVTANALCETLETLQQFLANERAPIAEETPPALRAARAAVAREAAWSAEETLASARSWVPLPGDPEASPSGVTEPAPFAAPPPTMVPGAPQINLPMRQSRSSSATLEYQMRTSQQAQRTPYSGPFVTGEHRETGSRSGMSTALIVFLLAVAAFIIFFLIGFFGPYVLGSRG